MKCLSYLKLAMRVCRPTCILLKKRKSAAKHECSGCHSPDSCLSEWQRKAGRPDNMSVTGFTVLSVFIPAAGGLSVAGKPTRAQTLLNFVIKSGKPRQMRIQIAAHPDNMLLH